MLNLFLLLKQDMKICVFVLIIMVVHAMFGMQYRKKRDNESLMAPNRYFPRYVILGKPRYEIPCDGEKGFSIHQ